jgi:hypothetical protein
LTSNDVAVYVTPAPVFTAFEGLDDRVFGRVKVLGRVLVLGLVAAADMTAGQAHAEMDPRIT